MKNTLPIWKKKNLKGFLSRAAVKMEEGWKLQLGMEIVFTEKALGSLVLEEMGFDLWAFELQ